MLGQSWSPNVHSMVWSRLSFLRAWEMDIKSTWHTVFPHHRAHYFFNYMCDMYARMKVCEDVCPHLYVLMCTCMGRPEDNLRCRSQEYCPPPLRQGFAFGLKLTN